MAMYNKRRGKAYWRRRKKMLKIGKTACVCLLIVGVGLAAVKIIGKGLHKETMAKGEIVGTDITESTDSSGSSQENTVSPPPLETEEEDDAITVVIDPGHGGKDGGTNYANVLEKDINLQISLKLQKELEELDYETIMTREDDTYISRQDRVKIANDAQADIYVSIHQNDYDKDQSVQGTEVWYTESSEGEESKRLAQLILDKVVEAMDNRKREIRESEQLYVTRETTMPSCLVETGFLTNSAERKKLQAEEYQEKIAKGIAQAIDSYFHPETT